MPILGVGTLEDELLPLNPYGGEEGDEYQEIRGCHPGKMQVLNIRNPQPGYGYVWLSHLKDGRGLLEAEALGAEPIRRGDPEFPGEAPGRRAATNGQGVDDLLTFMDVFAVRVPLDRLAEYEAEKKRQADLQLHGTMDAFENAADPLEERYGDRRGNPTRFHTKNHGITYEDSL